MKTIVTHNASFHTDDVFSVATLFLLYGKENCRVIRTRDEEKIKEADYVVDVGLVYDEDKNRFDHHQLKGAGNRENGVPFASFGLVWKKFGKELCGSDLVAERIDKTLVQYVDGLDNGFSMTKPVIPEVIPFDINILVKLYSPTWKEEGDWDNNFFQCVDWAMLVLGRLITVSKDIEKARDSIIETYYSSSDKKIIIFDKDQDFGRETILDVLIDFPEPVYAVLYRSDANNWQTLAIRKNLSSFESRKPFPESWRAKIDGELDKVTGLDGTVFCHRSGFMCIVKSKETAIELALKSLNA